MNRLVVWIIALFTCLISKMAADRGLDEILWHASFDYVYPQYSFSDGSMLSGLFSGTIAAALVSAGRRRPASLKESLIPAAASLFAGLVAGLTWAGIQFALSRFAPDDSNQWLAPRGRVWFCEGLVNGAVAGRWLGLIAGGLFVWCRRRRNAAGCD